MEVQTRSAEGELQYFPTMKAAMEFADTHRDVWKISFTLPNGERIRLAVDRMYLPRWYYEPIPLDEGKENDA